MNSKKWHALVYIVHLEQNKIKLHKNKFRNKYINFTLRIINVKNSVTKVGLGAGPLTRTEDPSLLTVIVKKNYFISILSIISKILLSSVDILEHSSKI